MNILLSAVRFTGKVLFHIERAFLVLFLSTMIVLAFTQIILRNFFSTSFLWADPLLRQLVLWAGFLGAAIAAQQEKHINLDLLTRFLKGTLLRLTKIIVSLFAAAVCGLLTNAAWTFFLAEREAGDELFNAGGMSFPAWWFQTIIPIGFVLLAVHFVLKAVEHGVSKEIPATQEIPPVVVPDSASHPPVAG